MGLGGVSLMLVGKANVKISRGQQYPLASRSIRLYQPVPGSLRTSEAKNDCTSTFLRL